MAGNLIQITDAGRAALERDARQRGVPGVLRRALEVSPELRFRTMDAFWAALLEALASVRGLAPPGLAHAAQLVPALVSPSGGAR